MKTTWLRDLREKLGRSYVVAREAPRTMIRLARTARDLVAASDVICELEAISAAVGQQRPARSAKRSPGRSHSISAIVAAGRARAWRVESLGHTFRGGSWFQSTARGTEGRPDLDVRAAKREIALVESHGSTVKVPFASG